MSAHTPGPWRLDLDEKLGDWQVLLVGGYGELIDNLEAAIAKARGA